LQASSGSRRVAVDDLGPAVVALEAGRPVVVPTDTVYGLAAMPGIRGGVRELFRIKGRAGDKPIAVLAGGPAGFAGIGVMDERARALAERFWPGPLTLVVPRAPGCEVDLGRGEGVAVRVPNHATMLDLLGLAGPLAVTSANRSGESPAETVEEARSIFGDEVAVYVDGGRCAGEPSTVVSLLEAQPKVLRRGPIALDGITAALAG
jgi:L-threonylcarbamoyladenylate synthase